MRQRNKYKTVQPLKNSIRGSNVDICNDKMNSIISIVRINKSIQNKLTTSTPLVPLIRMRSVITLTQV